jgi:hypothetical protein
MVSLDGSSAGAGAGACANPTANELHSKSVKKRDMVCMV